MTANVHVAALTSAWKNCSSILSALNSFQRKVPASEKCSLAANYSYYVDCGILWRLFGLVLNELGRKRILKFTCRTLVTSVGISGVHVGRFSTALKIHISQRTADILLQAGSFELEERGEIEIKVREDFCRPKKLPHRGFTHVAVCFREKGPIRLTGC